MQGNSDTLKNSTAWTFILVGVVLILISILFHTVHLVHTESEFLLVSNEIFAMVLSHLGIGGLAIGIITILFEMTHWTKYFEKRLSSIISEKEYLEHLDTDTLINLQTEVLKAYFKNDQIGGADGFLKYYQKNIQSIIGMPFRENVILNMKATRVDTNILLITESLSYKCMANSGKIQETIMYVPEVGEHEEGKLYYVTVQHESLKPLTDSDNTGKIIFDLEKMENLGACEDINKGFTLDIKDYNTDGLNIFIKTEYTINKNRFLGWRMSHPTKNLTIHIDFPIGLTLSKEFFFNENASLMEDHVEGSGIYDLNINDWLLPNEGITFQFKENIQTLTVKNNNPTDLEAIVTPSIIAPQTLVPPVDPT